MNKNIFKKFLLILDNLEIQNLADDEVIQLVYQHIIQTYPQVSLQTCEYYYQELSKGHHFKHRAEGFDLSQPLTLYARSKDTSEMEALSLFESCVRIPENRLVIEKLLDKTFELRQLEKAYLFPIFTDLLVDSLVLKAVDLKLDSYEHGMKTFSNQENKFQFNHKLMKQFKWILASIQDNKVCSDCTLAYYIHDHFKDMKLVYRNEDKAIIDYQHLDDILRASPKRGVPVDRDVTKDLQSFFKDCLFHEFNHGCSICGIDLPAMLIASHIKPFRDCSHLVEAADSSNGLLLCRNHDYLFDQGYISFDDNGCIMISSELKGKEAMYGLEKSFQFKKIYMNENRKQFLAYHRSTYYKK